MWLCCCYKPTTSDSDKQELPFGRTIFPCWGYKNSKEMVLDGSVLNSVLKLWEYMQLDDKLTKSDVILVLGNNDLRTAKYAAQLFKKGFADWLMFSGKDGTLTRGKWNRPEADVFCDAAIKEGIPPDKIILEREATNTGENVQFSAQVLKSHNIQPKKIILVQTPYMTRRAYATFMKQYPDADSIDVMVTSPCMTFQEYVIKDVGTEKEIISIMMGCLQRILVYPKKGYQIEQHVPNDVIKAFEDLKNVGFFNAYLLSRS